ncbi:MAG: prepilin-type N-terminal cleavage/methylation domain-containing protein [bacterium]|nr:prepilin-type N-terminal cleavage/methylation domain-containing protein [bacterium]
MAFSKIENKAGFTLVELMMVVAIIGILAGVAVPRYMDFLRRSREGATKGNLGSLRSALNIYYADTEFYFPRLISYDPMWPDRLKFNDGWGWVMQDDFKTYLDEIPSCTIGPSPSGLQATRSDIWHQGFASTNPPTPGVNDVGWWYYRSTDTVSGTGAVNTGRIYCNVNGVDTKGEYYTSW